jgi:hypothetical protein
VVIMHSTCLYSVKEFIVSPGAGPFIDGKILKRTKGHNPYREFLSVCKVYSKRAISCKT